MSFRFLKYASAQWTRVATMAFACLLGKLGPASAHSDIFLAEVGGQVAVGAAADLDGLEGGPFYDLETRVFEGVMVAGGTPPFFFDYQRAEPGFNAAPTSVVAGSNPLPANAAASLAFAPVTLAGQSSQLFYWDGTGAVDFQPVISPPVSAVDNPNFGTTGGSGGMDEHPLFAINTPGISIPADGVYVMGLSASVAGLTDSTPFAIVWLVDQLLVDDDAAEELEGLLEAFEGGGDEPVFGGKNFAFYEEGVEFVAESIPEPTGLGLMCSMLLSGLRGLRLRRA